MLGRCTVRLLEDYSIASLPSGVGSFGCSIVGRLAIVLRHFRWVLGRCTVGLLEDYSIASLLLGVGCRVVGLSDCWKTILLRHFRLVLGAWVV